MFGELEIFVCLALVSKMHGTDEAVVEAIDRMIQYELVTTNENYVLELIRTSNSPRQIVVTALKHHVVDMEDYVEV